MDSHPIDRINAFQAELEQLLDKHALELSWWEEGCEVRCKDTGSWYADLGSYIYEGPRKPITEPVPYTLKTLKAIAFKGTRFTCPSVREAAEKHAELFGGNRNG